MGLLNGLGGPLMGIRVCEFLKVEGAGAGGGH